MYSGRTAPWRNLSDTMKSWEGKHLRSEWKGQEERCSRCPSCWDSELAGEAPSPGGRERNTDDGSAEAARGGVCPPPSALPFSLRGRAGRGSPRARGAGWAQAGRSLPTTPPSPTPCGGRLLTGHTQLPSLQSVRPSRFCRGRLSWSSPRGFIVILKESLPLLTAGLLLRARGDARLRVPTPRPSPNPQLLC